MKRAAIVLTIVACALVMAQTHPTVPDTVSRSDVVLAARQALEGASRNLGRWLTFVIIAVLVAAVLAVWRISSLGRQVARLDDLRSSWESRFTGTADEVLRLKRKLADSESRAGRLEADMAALRPAEPDAATAQVAMVQSELVAVRERLDRVEQNLEAVADHTVVTKQERAAVEELVRIAGEERGRVEGLARTAADERARIDDLVKAAVGERGKVGELAKNAAAERARVEGLAQAAAADRVKVEVLVKTAARAQAAAEAGAVRAEAVARRAAAVDALRAGDQKLEQQAYPAAVREYTLCLESLAGGPADEPELRFHALHNRALANLRQREFGRVLVDAAEIERAGSVRDDGGEATRALGASRLLSGVARLWQGDVAHALEEFADATVKDAGARAAILQDEDIAAWVKVNPKRAAPVKQYLRELGREPKPPRP
jgi:hypothetical protein